MLLFRVSLTVKQGDEIIAAYQHQRDAILRLTARQLVAPPHPDDDSIPITREQARQIYAEGLTGQPLRLVIPWETLEEFEDQIGNGIFDSLAGLLGRAATVISSGARSVAKSAGKFARSAVGKIGTRTQPPPSKFNAPVWDGKDLSGFKPPELPESMRQAPGRFDQYRREAEATRAKYGFAQAARTPLEQVPPAWDRSNLGTRTREDTNF